MMKKQRSVKKTLMIDGDVIEGIEELLAASPELKEKDLINDLLRLGLQSQDVRLAPFKLLSFPGGLRRGITPEKLEELLDEI